MSEKITYIQIADLLKNAEKGVAHFRAALGEPNPQWYREELLKELKKYDWQVTCYRQKLLNVRLQEA